jgi:hypothetical protein
MHRAVVFPPSTPFVGKTETSDGEGSTFSITTFSTYNYAGDSRERRPESAGIFALG